MISGREKKPFFSVAQSERMEFGGAASGRSTYRPVSGELAERWVLCGSGTTALLVEGEE